MYVSCNNTTTRALSTALCNTLSTAAETGCWVLDDTGTWNERPVPTRLTAALALMHSTIFALTAGAANAHGQNSAACSQAKPYCTHSTKTKNKVKSCSCSCSC